VAALRDIGVDEVILDDGKVAGRVHSMVPGGVEGARTWAGYGILAHNLVKISALAS
jgi:hypothetical protein